MAIDALRTNHPRLISSLTKNPNLLKVRQTLEQTRAHSEIEIADLAAALKGTQRREERELCEEDYVSNPAGSPNTRAGSSQI